jgi:hypothetical protein
MRRPLFVLFWWALLLPPVSRGNPYGYYLILQAGGLVHDNAKIQNEAEQYIENWNKLNFVNATDGDALQNYTAWQGMERAYGDGQGVPGYVPNQTAANSTAVQQGIDRYAQSLPFTPAGVFLKDYLQRQQQRDRMILAYSARLRALAIADGQPSLTLEQCAQAANALRNLGYDNRLLVINEAAESDSIKLLNRDQQLKMREYRRQREDADSAWK